LAFGTRVTFYRDVGAGLSSPAHSKRRSIAAGAAAEWPSAFLSGVTNRAEEPGAHLQAIISPPARAQANIVFEKLEPLLKSCAKTATDALAKSIVAAGFPSPPTFAEDQRRVAKRLAIFRANSVSMRHGSIPSYLDSHEAMVLEADDLAEYEAARPRNKTAA
jgi:hypothetical protein